VLRSQPIPRLTVSADARKSQHPKHQCPDGQIDNSIETPASVWGTIVSLADIFNSLNRRGQKQVRNALRSLWNRKMIDGNAKDGYQLTSKGFDIAVDLIHQETKNR